MSEQTVSLIVKRHIRKLGGDESRFSAHSLRAGFATSAALAGASERSIAAQTGHKSVAVLRQYIRHGSLFTDNAATLLGL